MLDDNYRPVITFYATRTVFAGAMIDGVKEAYFFFGAQVLELVGLNWDLCGQVRALQDGGVITVARGSSIARANVYSMLSGWVFPANQTIADSWYDALDKPTSSDPLFFARGGAAVPAAEDGDGIEPAIGCDRPRGALVSAR
ncbi:hypothetical protein [Nannocystis punicea]|uniref:Uncharacterized protein n=1 Tax=Nannocystis punicea TaxID=2995304 RepID=A0ABY7H8V9_9BACT|nr:hypothetical protein [Nannocystis poenicansa]WAS95671.1 hypothetical protein O0S08_05870 [Nannocystis poenicansa]